MTASPIMLLAPFKSRWVSRRLYVACPASSAVMLPRSPTCRSAASGCAVRFAFGIEVATR